MSITAVQHKLIARIKDAFEGIGKLQVDSLPAELTPEILLQIAVSLPGVYVIFAGGTPRLPGARATADISARWVVVVVTRSAAGFKRGTEGDAKNAGAFDLVDALIPVLHNFTVKDEGTLAFAGIENLYDGKFQAHALTIYALLFDMQMTWPATADPALLGELKTLFAQYDTPPHDSDAEHRKWIEGDESTSKPDAKDSITLPTE